MTRLTLALVLMVVSVPAFAETFGVQVGNNFFSPNSLTVTEGDSVQWNVSAGVHNVSGPGCSSGTLGPGSMFSCTFDSAGMFMYQCTFHRGMDGQVTIEPAPIPEPSSLMICSLAAFLLGRRRRP